MAEKKKTPSTVWLRIIGFLSGTALIHLGEVLKGYFEKNKIEGFWHTAFANTLIELGIGLFVAVAVSWIFDWAYHKITFGEPIEEIEDKIKELSVTVGNFNQVLKSAQKNGIAAIYRRRSSTEKEHWKDRVGNVVKNANKFLFVFARSLDDILPFKHRHDGLSIEIMKCLERGVKITFILANTFDKDADFRIECERRDGDNAISLYSASRDTIKQLLEIADKLKAYNQLSVKLLKRTPPFAMFMSENIAIIEPYLPYIEGGQGLIFEIDSKRDIYEAHYCSYQELFKDAEPVFKVMQRWVDRQTDESEKTRYHKYLPFAEKMALYRVELIEHPDVVFTEKNHSHEDSKITNHSQEYSRSIDA